MHSLINHQVGTILRPTLPYQIPAVRQVHQNPEALYLRQDVNHRIDTKRCGNALPPNHPYLQVSVKAAISFCTLLLTDSTFTPIDFVFHVYYRIMHLWY